ncbi:gustatory and odorant receptor 63a-like isoform X1 [Frankliniella occidentalis]|uniref:Gustatory and odorant receptor 63a-like isoform X1 n=1 Tax=Frankliniella occidentalis TaxID=133901 RepID=A0A6J1T554_FRAOC|nr:gustatory and odorant receptor 63a-like isoform X1 [Frankliniella occidentalis]
MTLGTAASPMASKLQPTARAHPRQGQEVAEDGADTLYHEVASLRGAMFLFALWPIHSGERGMARASVLSHSTCYTVLVYAVWSVFNVRTLAARWTALGSAAAADGGGGDGSGASDLNTRLVNLIVLALLAHHWLLPVAIWPEAATLAKYFNDWTAFQVEWFEVTGQPLELRVHARALASAAVGVAFPALLILLMVQAGESPAQAAALFPPLCFFFLVGGVWSTLCRAVETSARRLREAFHAERELGVVGNLGVRRLRAYGLLWLRLRALAARAGAAQSGTLLVYTVYSMALGLVASIGVLVALLHADLGRANSVQALFLVESLHHIYTVHDAGHKAAQAAANALRYEMLCVKSPAKDGGEMDTEVRTLIMATEMHQGGPQPQHASVISLGGFAAVSRSSMIEVYNILLINLLVLLQFAYFVY